MYVMRNATEEDAVKIAPLLREVDKQEMFALTGHDGKDELVESVRASLSGDGFCKVCLVDDEYVVIFGVCPTDVKDEHGNIIGCPWMMATNKLYDPMCVEHFLEDDLGIVEEMNRRFLFLTNVIDERNTISIKWLKHVGFIFQQRILNYGYEQRPFWVFYRDRREIKGDT